MFCPHCDATLPAAWALDRAGRCPTCRLVVGAGRATSERGAGTAVSAAGTAAGMLAGAARREEAEAGDAAVVAGALRQTAASLGVEPGRLRMLDYQQVADLDPTLPGLGTVLATFGTWKTARARAAVREPELLPPALTDDESLRTGT